MKKILFLACLACSMLTQAQMKEGRLIYERTLQLPSQMRNAEPEIAAQLPKSRTDQFELLFSGNHSLWQFLPTANNEDPGTFSAGGVVLRFGGTNEVAYYNFEKGTRTEQREIMGRNFVVTDTIPKDVWKMTGESKKILNYTAQKAIGQRITNRTQMSMENGEMKRTIVPDTSVVVAWFTTEIPVPVGPEVQGQLPGAVLELEVNNGQTVYRLLEVSTKVNTAKIREPRDGKKLTAAEFVVERDKLFEERRKNMGSNGNRSSVIITN